MQPDPKFITITDNKNKIIALLNDLVFQPRVKALGWSRITKQTPNLKIGYPGQHLASLITGIEGARTGARGDDLLDGTEVKSCSRVDQLDTCKSCGEKVLRIETQCANCGSTDIKRMDDSKWLFGVKSEEELELLTVTVPRVFITLADYPNFSTNDFETIRIQAFEIWNNTERHKNFATIMQNYFYKIFLEHIKVNPNKTPAPKNFWPYSYQFYLCNPVKVFECTVTNANANPSVTIDLLVQPNSNRSGLAPELMPTQLLSQQELQAIFQNAQPDMIRPYLIQCEYEGMRNVVEKGRASRDILAKHFPYINETLRGFVELRDTDVISVSKSKYSRR